MSAAAAQKAVKESPILFKAEMMRAIFEGRKWVTRCLRGLDLINESPGDWFFMGQQERSFVFFNTRTEENISIRSPYGIAGDRLWTRETWAPHPEFTLRSPDGCIYRADRGGDYQGAAQGDFKWKPSIFMPRWASRLTLDITSLWPQRLHSTWESDFFAEGIKKATKDGNLWKYGLDSIPWEDWALTPRAAFSTGWSKINPKSPWEKNDWVWRVEFPKV
jgi:hypothetical protein